MKKEEHRELIDRYLEGDYSAGELLFSEVMRLLGYFLERSSIKEEDRQDVLQDSLVLILKKIKDFDPTKAKLSTFVFWQFMTAKKAFFDSAKRRSIIIYLPPF